MTVTVDQLRNLTDRAARGPLTADEQQRLRDGINQLEALQQIARGYCPDCGRGDAAPTVEDWERERQRADRAEAALARQAQETATWRATANTLDAGGPGTPRHRAEQAEQRLARVQRLLDSGPIGTCCDHLLRAALDARPAATQATESATQTKEP